MDELRYDTRDDKTILKLLSKKIDELGRKPTLGDIQADPQLRSVQFRKRFGNLNKAIDLANNLRTKPTQKPLNEKERLVLALLNEINARGYMLSRIEIDYCPRLEDSSVYEKCFGGWDSFLDYLNARFPSLRVREPSRECIISSLKLKAAEQPSSTVKYVDVVQDKRMPKNHCYRQVFGSFKDALCAAGLSTTRRSDDEFLVLLQCKAEELGRQPTAHDVDADESLPAYKTYRERFQKPWNEILKLAGLNQMPDGHRQALNLDKEKKRAQAIEELQNVAKRLGRAPRYSDLSRATELSHAAGYYIDHFGTFGAAVRAAGLVPIERVTITDAELVEELRRKANELGYQPTSSEVDRDPGMHSSATFYHHFGKPWAKSLMAAGLGDFPTKPEFTTEQKKAAAIKELKAAAERLGRTPAFNDLKTRTAGMPHNAYYYAQLFGSFPEALRAAGFNSTKRKRTPRSPH
ncbi:hypothetical protein IKT64_03130 [Candidatus Saccharibacteria bacterium]|nr:hypothetical protein [Candidatus Saccharibacteria bacterium]